MSSVDDVLKNPTLLKGKSLEEVQNLIGNSKNWVNDVMQKSKTNPKGGWLFYEINTAGNRTGRTIQYHPGTSRHFN